MENKRRNRRKTLTQAQKRAIFAKMKSQGVPYSTKRFVRVEPKGRTLDIKKDMQRKAKHVGKRISKDGNVYYEKRANRSDVNSYDHRKSSSTKSKKTIWL